MPGEIDISYVVPVYNALPYLKRCVSSLKEQRFDTKRLELIFVDDGSTDGSGEYLDSEARDCPNMQVIHIEPSGGPGKPRNIGVERAKGEYVFFCDADDYMERSASQRMLEHVRAWKSDIVLVRPKGEGGRSLPKAFERTLPKADVYESGIALALGPCKLFRRQFLQENGLAFTSNLPVWEDQIFVLRAYLLADTVSVAADGVYCHWVTRDDGGNASNKRQEIPYQSVWLYIDAALGVMDELAAPGKAQRMLAPRILREGLFYAARALAREPESERPTLFEQLRKRALPYVGEGCYRMFNAQRCLALEAFEADDLDSWIAICATDARESDAFSPERFQMAPDGSSLVATWQGQGHSYEVDACGLVPPAPKALRADLSNEERACLEIAGTLDRKALLGAQRCLLRVAKRRSSDACLVPAETVVDEQGEARWSACLSAEEFFDLGKASRWDVSFLIEYANGRRRSGRVDSTALDLGARVLWKTRAEGAREDTVLLPFSNKSGKLAFADPLSKAKLVVKKKRMGQTVQLEGIHETFSGQLGRLAVECTASRSSKTVPVVPGVPADLGMFSKKPERAVLVVSCANGTARRELPLSFAD